MDSDIEIAKKLAEIMTILGILSNDVAELKRRDRNSHDAQTELEGCVKGLTEANNRMSTLLDKVTAQIYDLRQDQYKTQEQLGALQKLVWALIIPVLLTVINTIIRGFV